MVNFTLKTRGREFDPDEISTPLQNLKIIFSPPAFGKSSWLEKINKNGLNKSRFIDGDDILKLKISPHFGKPLIDLCEEYKPFKNADLNWHRWHCECLDEILRIQKKCTLGPVLCGYMVGEKKIDVLDNMSKFFVKSGETIPARMVGTDQIIIVLPKDEEQTNMYKERYLKREIKNGKPEKDINRNWPDICISSYKWIWEKWPDIKVIHSFDDLLKS